MRSNAFYLVACLLAALVPWASLNSKPQGGDETASKAFPGWPTHFEGRELTALPLQERERRFASDFPGRIARFTDGKREIIIRWVTEATRKLHPASDCFEGIGYSIHPQPLRVDGAGERWGSFTAVRRDEKLRVYERIYTDTGQSWTDVSAWYWAADENAAGAWWAVTVAENETAIAP
jgi:hypothetical protein